MEDHSNSHTQIWEDFCEQLKSAGKCLLRDDLANSELDRTEGVRYLSRLLRAGLESVVENPGSKYPVFRAMAQGVKTALSNPDNYYLSVSVNSQYDYKIRGNRGTIHYLSFAAQNLGFAKSNNGNGNENKGAGQINADDLILEEDGSFEIIVSCREHPGNWLGMTEETTQIFLRQTFLNRETEHAVTVEIECLQTDCPPEPLKANQLEKSLVGSTRYVEGIATWFTDWVTGMAKKSQAGVNELFMPSVEEQSLIGGDPNVMVLFGLWELSEDEALVVDLSPPECHYWNFCIGNIWAEVLDGHINNGRAQLDSNGLVRIVVSAKDPGVVGGHWIDTAGHNHGTMCARWVLAESHPIPKCQLVALDSL